MRLRGQEILEIAMAQSAVDLGCEPEDFTRPWSVIVDSVPAEGARAYLDLPFLCDMVSYGSNVVASIDPRLEGIVKRFLQQHDFSVCMASPDVLALDAALAAEGCRVWSMGEYFLPDVERLVPLPCPYPTRWMWPEDYRDLYTPEWSDALCEKRKHLDTLGLGAFDGEKLVGLAGSSMDCETMWQIGIDVLPEYRGQGIASALTSHLALELLRIIDVIM